MVNGGRTRERCDPDHQARFVLKNPTVRSHASVADASW